MITTPASPVALKKMKNKDDFEREMAARFDNEELVRALQGHVIDVIGWHIPEGATVQVPAICHNLKRADISIRRQGAATTTSDVDSSEEKAYILVMPQGLRSLWLSLGSERVAGFDIPRVLNIGRQVLVHLNVLHGNGIVHGDVKPRNLLVSSNSNDLLLCDLDTALPINSLRTVDIKRSTGYSPPELMRSDLLANSQGIQVQASFDIWSFGVLLFELLSGRHLFQQDINDDNMVDEGDIRRLTSWLCLNDIILASVLPQNEGIPQSIQADIKYILRWCLASDPADRPSANQLLAHAVFGGVNVMPAPQLITLPSMSTLPLIEKHPARMRYHVFISHYQLEASGDVGTLFYLFDRLGIHAWRDMNTSEITEAAMRQGVYDSDVFILLLTNSTLSRSFCLKEIGWAIEFGKAIVVLVEQDDRFWPWNFQRWMNDECARAPGGNQQTWTTGWLQHNYSTIRSNCPEVVHLVKSQYNQGLMLPFRRREFEVLAMVQEVFSRVETAVCWRVVPASTVAPLSPYITSPLYLYLVADTSLAAISLLVNQLKVELQGLVPTIVWANQPTSASHLLVLLAETTVDVCSTELTTAALQYGNRTLFIFSVDHGWDFPRFYNRPDDEVKRFISNSEALALRVLAYERRAVLKEVLKRMNIIK